MLFLQNGMPLHCLLAASLLLWGAALLKQPPENRTKSSGWILLSLPCPVFFLVILFSGGFMHALYPPPWLFVWLYLVFFVVSCISGLVVGLMKSREPVHGLGIAYRLKNGSIVYVPEKENPTTDTNRQEMSLLLY